MLGIDLVEQVIHAGTEQGLLVGAIAGVEGEDAEAAAASQVLAVGNDVTGTHVVAVLGRNEPGQGTDGIGLVVIGQADPQLQGRLLGQGLVVRIVAAAHVSQGAVALPGGIELVGQVGFAAVDGGIHIARHRRADPADQQVVLHLAVEAGDRTAPGTVAIVGAHVQLGGLFRLDVEEDAGGRRQGIALAPLPEIGGPASMAQAGVPGAGPLGKVVLVTQETAAQGLLVGLTPGDAGGALVLHLMPVHT
eukprot:TRINITY_DN25308_c0_g1_i1.p2 TRINITY_DN25308_c0_g1~~TRINITY_DN25308_c0_g1_i1.p2  ORF type:complete len:248 (+),score=-18.44 TRINITY_DN25308_c0_g1_i1:116-859(+)